MPNLIVIFGPPASGKAAIGHELAQITGYRFFHNHLTSDAVAALFERDSAEFYGAVSVVRDVLLRQSALSSTVPGVIFTTTWALDVPEDTAALERYACYFQSSGGTVFFVELLASLEARLEREGTPFRVSLKPFHRNVEAARQRQLSYGHESRLNTGGKLPLPYPHLVVDTEANSPSESAQLIQQRLLRVAPAT